MLLWYMVHLVIFWSDRDRSIMDATYSFRKFYGTNCALSKKKKKKFKLIPSCQYLWIWPYLEIGGCIQTHELLIAKFRLKLKKVEKTTKPLRYDLNQIPYDYTMEVTNSFKGLVLIDRVPEALWRVVHDIVQEALRPSPRKIDLKRQNACLRRPYK